MHTVIGIIFVLFWVVSGLGAAGICYAHFQRKYPSLCKDSRGPDRMLAFGFALSGPIGFVVALISSSWCRYGWLAPWSSDPEADRQYDEFYRELEELRTRNRMQRGTYDKR